MYSKLLKQILRMTRITFWGLVLQAALVNVLIASSPGSAQTRSVYKIYVTIESGNHNIGKIFPQIEQQTKFTFAYKNDKLIDRDAFIDLPKKASLGDVLKEISKETDLSFKRVDDLILVRVKDNIAEMKGKAVIEEKIKVTGQVTASDNGDPLPGVNVVVKGTSIGTITDVNGQYAIEVDDSAILIFSYTGYLTQEIAVGNQSVINLQLLPDLRELEEIVVVGYGTQKKSHLTGSIGAIESKDLQLSATANVSNALIGRITGLSGVQQSGQPGEDRTQFNIRGQSSLNDASPLILVDGVNRDLNGYNPMDIASISVLKDAASASVYGVRAANGVILTTLKRGVEGKPTFSFSTNVGWARPTVLPEFANSFDFTRLFNEARANDGEAPAFSDEAIENYRNSTDRDRYPDTDWIKNGLKKNQVTKQYALSVRGGTEKARYYISSGILDQSGIVNNVSYKRYNLLANLDFDINDNFSLRFDLAGRYEDRDTPGVAPGPDIFGPFYSMWPIYKDKFSNGLWGRGRNGDNPIQRQFESGFTKDDRQFFTSTIGFNYKLPIKGMSLGGNYSFDRTSSTTKSWQTPLAYYELLDNDNDGVFTFERFQFGNPSLNQSQSTVSLDLYETFLTYEKSLEGGHDFRGFALYSQRKFKTSSIAAGRINFSSTEVPQLNAGSADKADQSNAGDESVEVRQGMVGKLNYSYQGKYLFEASFRYEGSEKFSKDERWGFFPAFSVGWNLAQENFFGNVSWIDQLKIRASWGKLGFDEITAFRFLNFYQQGPGYVFNGSTGVSSLIYGAIPDASATWEKATTTNIGLNTELFGGKIDFEADYFFRRTTDILVPDQGAIPATLGAELPEQNLASVDNKGYELVVRHRNHFGPVEFVGEVNFTRNQNELVKTSEPEALREDWSLEGQPLGTRLMLKAIGLYQSQEEIDNSPRQDLGIANQPGDIKYMDANGDGIVNLDDRVLVDNNTLPKSVIGLNLKGRYKGFSLDVLFQGSYDFTTYLNATVTKAFIDNASIQKWHVRERWTADNPNATYPRLSQRRGSSNDQVSTFWLKDASFLRLKSVTLNYSLPAQIVEKFKLQDVTLGVSGFNLATWSDLDIVDPSAPNNQGAGFYPVMRNYNVSLNISF